MPPKKVKTTEMKGEIKTLDELREEREFMHRHLIENLGSYILPTMFRENYKDNFSKKLYQKLLTMSYNQINNYLSELDTNYQLTNKDNLVTLTFDYETKNCEIVMQHNINLKEEYPYRINRISNVFYGDFLEPAVLEEKLMKNTSRYFSLELIFAEDKSAHSVLLTFDTHNLTCFIIDSSNSSFFKGFDHREIERSMIGFYTSLIGYTYIQLHDINSGISVNNKTKNQKDFFIGYCRGYTLLFQYIMIKEENIDILELLRNMKKLELDVIMDIMENFYGSILKDKFEKYITLN